MALLLRAKHFLKGHHGQVAARGSVVMATAAGAGLALGKISDSPMGAKVRKYGPPTAVGVGAVASLVGAGNPISDGLAGVGASLIGYKLGAKRAAAEVASTMPALPRPQGAKRR